MKSRCKYCRAKVQDKVLLRGNWVCIECAYEYGAIFGDITPKPKNEPILRNLANQSAIEEILKDCEEDRSDIDT